MRPDLEAAMTAHHGLITRAQARDLGQFDADLRHLVHTGEWVRLRRGVYCDARVWQAADEFRGRPLLQARAAVMQMGRSWVLSHDSSAHLLELPILSVPNPYVHVTRSGVGQASIEGNVKHHIAGFHPQQVTRVDGVPALDLARTAVDVARERDEQHGLVACDSALRMGVPRLRLWDAVGPMVSWRHVRRVRWCIENADPRAESVLESLGREFVMGLGIGAPDPQFPVRVGSTTFWADLRVGCHLFEMHGAVKYRPPAEGGVASAPAADVLLRERKRERLLVSEGLGVTNLYFEDFFGVRRQQARERALADVAATVARFGRHLPARLAGAAEQIRAGHPRANLAM